MRKLILAIATTAAAAGFAAACGVHQTEVPPLAGPSELGLSLTFSATPDAIAQDGASQSVLRVVAYGPNGQPKANVHLQLQITSNGAPVDYGTLASRDLFTANDGSASTTYTAPPAPIPSQVQVPACHGLAGPCVTIIVASVEGNYQLSQDRAVDIRLVPPPTPPPDPNALTAAFTVSNANPASGDVVTFNASGSHAALGHTITQWTWDFGDGTIKYGQVQTHDFFGAGSYTVTLTVTQDDGQSASISYPITVH